MSYVTIQHKKQYNPICFTTAGEDPNSSYYFAEGVFFYDHDTIHANFQQNVPSDLSSVFSCYGHS